MTYSGWFTHISGHPSAVGRAQDRESLPVKDRRSTTVPSNRLLVWGGVRSASVCIVSTIQQDYVPVLLRITTLVLSNSSNNPIYAVHKAMAFEVPFVW